MDTTAPSRAWLRLLLVFVSLAAGVAGQYYLKIAPLPAWSAAAWGLAAVAAVALYFIGRDAADFPSFDPKEMPRQVEWAAFALLLAIGAFFIGFRIDQIPNGLNHDAAWEGLYAIRILNGERYTPYTPEAWGRETLTFYFRAWAIALLGPTYRAIQAPGLVAGVLILPFFYVWARVMFGARTAWVTATFLAASGWHMVFSRTGWRSDFQPFFMAVTCCFFLRGMQSAKPLDFFFSGLGLAATLNIYNGSRVFPLIFPVWLVLVIAQSWRFRAFVRRYGTGLVFMAVAFLIAIAPLAWFAVHDWDTFQGRAAALRGASSLVDSLRSTLGLFNYRGNGDDFFIDDPALELPTAVLFVFGLIWCILRWKDERAQFLLIAVVVNLIPGMVSKPNLNRDIGTMVFVYFFVGLGALFFARQLQRALGGAGRVVATLFLLLAVGSSMVATYNQYLGPNRRPIWGYYPETTVLGHYLKTIVPDYNIWVGGANFPRDSLTYLSYQGSGEPRPNYVWLDDIRTLRTMDPRPRPGKGLAFVLANEGYGPQVLSDLARRFPQHRVEDLHYVDPRGEDRIFAKALLVPGDNVANVDGKERPAAPSGVPEPAGAEVAAENVAPPGDFQQPRGIAVLSDGSLVVSDFGHHRVQRLGRDLKFITQWGDQGDAHGQFKEPSGIATSSDDRVAVADTWNGRVQLFSAKGEWIGQSAVPFYGPRGVAFAPDGSLVVADTGNSRMVRLKSDGSLLATWGSLGKEDGRFTGPVGVATDAGGSVVVADNGNGRIQIFNADGSFKSAFAVDGWRDGVYSEPYVAVDAENRIWVSVPLEHEIRAYDRTGKVLRSVKPVQTEPPFETPLGIAYDPSSRQIVIADLTGRIIRVDAAPGP